MVGRQLAVQLAGRTPLRYCLYDLEPASDSIRFGGLDPSSFPLALCGVDRVF